MTLRLLSPDVAQGGASTGTTETPDTGAELFEGGDNGQTTETPAAGATTTEAGAPPAVAAPAPTGLSKDDLQTILTGALEHVGKAAPAATAAPAKELSQEDFERAFNVLKLSPELLAQIRHEDPATALKAFAQLRDGLVRQAMTMAEYRMQQLVKEMRDNDLAPIQSFVSEAQATSFRSDFFKTNPDLEQYETIVDAVAAKLAQSGVRGTRAEMMGHYATESKKIIDQLTAAKGGTAGAAATTKTNGNGTPAASRRMSTLTGGGQSTGGGKASGAGEAKGPPGIEVFD